MFMDDFKKTVAWLTPVVARGIAWLLSGWLGFASAEAEGMATKITGLLASLVIVIASVYWSKKGRDKLEDATEQATAKEIADTLDTQGQVSAANIVRNEYADEV
jgi:glucose-6-phosphate-specific signal transduction histidine kinase